MSIDDAEAQDAANLLTLRTAADITDFLQVRWMSVDQDSSFEVLDDLVHDCKGREASDINNNGVERQVEYLVEQIGAEQLAAALKEDLYQ